MEHLDGESSDEELMDVQRELDELHHQQVQEAAEVLQVQAEPDDVNLKKDDS